MPTSSTLLSRAGQPDSSLDGKVVLPSDQRFDSAQRA